jgi:hypothetical protein
MVARHLNECHGQTKGRSEPEGERLWRMQVHAACGSGWAEEGRRHRGSQYLQRWSKLAEWLSADVSKRHVSE